MGLLKIPLIPTLVGMVLLGTFWQRMSAARTPAVETWCGDPALVEMDHVRLRDCEVGDAFYGEHDVWVGLHRPTAEAPSVIVHFHGMDAAAIENVLVTELASGTLDVARTDADVRGVAELRGHSDLVHAVFVGDWRSDGGAEMDGRSGAAAFIGIGLIFIDVFRLAAWFFRRLRGR